MSSLLGNLFDFRSKEEKQSIYEDYSKRIFPYGDAQKDRIAELLAALFPEQSARYVLMHYILIKDGMTKAEALDFDTAAKKAKSSSIRKTPELQAGMCALLNVDLNIDENLEYPSLEGLRASASKILLKG